MNAVPRSAASGWLAARRPAAEAALAGAVSADIVHARPEFGQVVRPSPGSVVASRVSARWDPEPDYVYHWVRDAAVAMLAASAFRDVPAWRARFDAYAAFSERIATRPGCAANPLAASARPEFRRFLRPDGELRALAGDALLAEPRAGADGAPDLERWARPQFDGPALRALSCMAWGGGGALLARDIDFTARHAARPCIGPWEEEGEHDLHAFTLLAQRAALRAAGRDVEAIDAALGGLWDKRAGVLRARAGAAGPDAAIILGALLNVGDFGLDDPRVLATAAALEAWSLDAFSICAPEAPGIGRNASDRYFGGNPWLPTTLGFAELHYALARRVLERGPLPDVPESAGFRRRLDGARDPRSQAAALILHGDRFAEFVRRHAPADGRLPEQIDRETGAPASCPDLTWSHAALLTAAAAREAAETALDDE